MDIVRSLIIVSTVDLFVTNAHSRFCLTGILKGDGKGKWEQEF